MSSLLASHISKSYPTPSQDLVVLEDVSFEIGAGENMAIVGPSGCGKSTLLQIVGGLDQPTSGSLLLDGIDPFKLTMDEQAKFRNERIGFVFQDQYLLPQWDVLENTLLPSLAQVKKQNPSLRSRAVELLERVGLQDRLTHLPSQLSGGERGRVAIARALLMKPLLLLADEPTGNLDEENADRVASLMLEMQREENAILIVVTHSAELANRMQKRYQLRHGKLHLALG